MVRCQRTPACRLAGASCRSPRPGFRERLWGRFGLYPKLRVRLRYGESDSTVPPQASAAFEALLAEAGYDVGLIGFEGGHTVPRDEVVETVTGLVW